MESDSIWSASVPEWLTAVGTVGTVFVALFCKSIRQWYNRPKIEITCKKSNPCVEVSETSSQSSSGNKEIRLRVKLINTGNYIANNCLLVIDSYYSLRPDGVYAIKEFTPKQMRDYRNANLSFIAPHLNYYYDIISIRQFDDLRGADDAGHARQFYKPSILGEGRPIDLSKGTFIIPIKFYSSKLATVITYLKLFWDNDECTTDNNKFDYYILSEDDFKKLKKG